MVRPGQRPAGYVQSLERGLAVISCFSAERPRLTLSEVARQTGVSRAAARRSLITLQTLGYVGSDGRQFYLTPRVLTLGYAYLSSLSLADVAQSHLTDLANDVHESCSASVLDGFDIVYVARAATKRIMTISLSVGTRLPAYATSMGRVLLAGLSAERLQKYFATAQFVALTSHTVTDPGTLMKLIEECRRVGHSAVEDELAYGVVAVAVPVYDQSRRVVAALNTSSHSKKISKAKLVRERLGLLQELSAQISRELLRVPGLSLSAQN